MLILDIFLDKKEIMENLEFELLIKSEETFR